MCWGEGRGSRHHTERNTVAFLSCSFHITKYFWKHSQWIWPQHRAREQSLCTQRWHKTFDHSLINQRTGEVQDRTLFSILLFCWVQNRQMHSLFSYWRLIFSICYKDIFFNSSVIVYQKANLSDCMWIGSWMHWQSCTDLLQHSL